MIQGKRGQKKELGKKNKKTVRDTELRESLRFSSQDGAKDRRVCSEEGSGQTEGSYLKEDLEGTALPVHQFRLSPPTWFTPAAAPYWTDHHWEKNEQSHKMMSLTFGCEKITH